MSEQSKDALDSLSRRYGLAIACSVLFLLLKLWLKNYLGDNVPFVLFFSAVMISAWFGGLGPGILATALSTTFAAVFFMGLVEHKGFWNRTLPPATFAVEGVCISVLSHSRRRVLQDRTSVLQRERTAREHAEQVGQRLEDALKSSKQADGEQYRLSAEVERQARIFDTTLSAITDFVYILDREARFRYVNKALLDLWGLKLDQAIGKNFFDLGYPNDLAGKLADQVKQVFETRRGLSDETPYTSPTGIGGTYEYIFSPIIAADGTVEVIAGSTRDVSEHKRTEEELRRLAGERENLLSSERAARSEAERAGRIKDEFLATLSHELRTPLNAILGWSQILASPPRSEEDLTEGLAAIDRNARVQTQIIEDLLDMSGIISGKVRFDVQRVDLASVVRSAVDTLRPAADAKGVQLQVVLDALVAPVNADPGRLHQIFWNLLSNAVKFTPGGGRVQVRLEQLESRFQVNITDTGEGIRPEFLPHVFDRFSQSDASTTRRHGGLGLGLAIVKQLVELHGGTVHATSLGDGRGATFTVCLPTPANHNEPAQSSEPRRLKPAAVAAPVVPDTCANIAGTKVLVVDDEPDARALMKRLLEEYDAVVTVAASAEGALERLKADPPDVIASDIGMPGVDGYELIRRVRALGPEQGGDTPALALTAYAHASDRDRTMLAGFQHHIAKPIDPAELIATIARLTQVAKRNEIGR